MAVQTDVDQKDLALMAQKEQIFSMLGNMLTSEYRSFVEAEDGTGAFQDRSRLGTTGVSPLLFKDKPVSERNLENELLTVNLLKQQLNLTLEFTNNARNLRDQTMVQIERELERKQRRREEKRAEKQRRREARKAQKKAARIA